MRLCYINYSSGWGGLEMYSADLFEALVSAGYAIDFFVESGAPLEARLRDAGHGARLLPRKSRKYVDFGGFRALKACVLRGDAKLVHTFRSADIFHSVLGTRSLGARRPALLHHLQMLPHRSRRDFFHSSVYAQLDRVLTITEQMRGSVQALWPVAPERVETLYYGLDRGPLAGPDAKAARAELGLSPEATVVGLVGQVCEIKGQRFVLEALAPRVDAGEIELVFIGQPVRDAAGAAYARELEADIARLARPAGVHVAGFRADAVQLLAALDVFVLGSREEPFGRVVIESMAQGCLTIGSRAGGVPEIIDDGVDGWLYAARDVEDLRAVVERVLALDGGERARIRAAAEQKVATRFSQARHLAEMARVYSELTGTERGALAAADLGGEAQG